MISSTRRHGREAALQVLYLADVCRAEAAEVPEKAWSEDPLAPKIKEFAERLVSGVLERQPDLDSVIRKYAQNWEMHRMAAVDRCILRLAAYELLFDPDTPVSVVINEAVEIAKAYSTADSGKFVNGILDKVKLERKA
jgi:transcription antitermination protein NusB